MDIKKSSIQPTRKEVGQNKAQRFSNPGIVINYSWTVNEE
jgi:hypothetical protein